jgi:hypothetical protein
MSFHPPVDVDPSPTGDTVNKAVLKNETNIADVYENLNHLLDLINLAPTTGEQILDLLVPVDCIGLDADMVDGRHATDFASSAHGHSAVTQAADGFMAAIDKQKLDGIQTGAESNVQSDWTQTSSSSDAFIRNKPKVAHIDGAPVDGDIGVFTGPLSMRGATPTEMHSILGYFKQDEFIEASAGAVDAGKPITLDAGGLVHPSMIPAVPAQAIWGAITGTLSNQTDLQAELDGKASTGHNHDGVYEPELGNPSTDGFVLSSTVAGVRSWVAQTGGGGGDAVWGSIPQSA